MALFITLRVYLMEPAHLITLTACRGTTVNDGREKNRTFVLLGSRLKYATTNINDVMETEKETIPTMSARYLVSETLTSAIYTPAS